MAIQVTHATTAVGTEAGDGEIGKAEWNADHSLSMASDRILGRTTAGAGSPEELSAGSGLTLASGSLDVAGYKYLGSITKNTSTTIVTPLGGDFTTWQQTYQRMKVVLTTTYGSAFLWRLSWKNNSTTINSCWSFQAYGNTGSYPRTLDSTSASYTQTGWYAYHYNPTVVLDIFAMDGKVIADSTASNPRIFGYVCGTDDLTPEIFYMGIVSSTEVTNNGLYIVTSTSAANTTLHAWGM